MSDELTPIEIRRRPFDNDTYDKAVLAFEMHHEMSYHEMCAVIKGLRAEVERLRAEADATRPFLQSGLLAVSPLDAWHALMAECEQRRHADSVCRKLADNGGIDVAGGKLWFLGDNQQIIGVALDAGELAYLRSVTSETEEPQ